MTGHFIGRVGSSPGFATAPVQTLLGQVAYDPASAVTNFAAALSAMTAVDTTHCRVTFTAPASGKVLVRIRAPQWGGTSGGINALFFGVLEGASVVARQCPIYSRGSGASSARNMGVSEFAITGLTAGSSHSYDLAVGVNQAGAAAAGAAYGGPDNSTTNDAWGAIQMEVWDASNLLAAANYDPAVMVSKSTASLQAMTAFDTTNLRCTFTAPNSGNVEVRALANWVAPATSIIVGPLLGVLESSTVVARQSPFGGVGGGGTVAANGFGAFELRQVVTGLSAGSHSYDAAYGVEIVLASSNFKYGGPNDATGADAAGMLRFEVWAA